MSLRWDSKTGQFVESTGKGRSKNTAARALLDTASKKGKTKSFSVEVTMIGTKTQRPSITPAIAQAWASENNLDLVSAKFEQSGKDVVLSVVLA